MKIINFIIMVLGLLYCIFHAQQIYAQTYDCVIAGCSNEKCVKSDQTEGQFGICLWQEDFVCYHKYGKCIKHQDGSCGWQQTIALKQCLSDKQNASW